MVLVDKNKEVKINFLTPKVRQEILEKIDGARKALRYIANWEDNNKVKEFIDFERRVNDIKKFLDEIKTNSPEEEEQKRLLEQKILRAMEKLTRGIDYWEDIEHELLKIELQNLEEYVGNNLINHSKFNDQIKKKLQEGAKQEEIEDIYWEFDKPEELLNQVKNGKLNETIMEIIEKGEQDSKIHLKAISVSEIRNKEIAKELREEIIIKLKESEIANKNLEKAEARIKELERELAEKSKNLDISNNNLEKAEIRIKELENERLQEQLRSVNNLSKKRKRNNAEQERETKTKLQKLNKKKEYQQLITSIEVPTKK